MLDGKSVSEKGQALGGIVGSMASSLKDAKDPSDTDTSIHHTYTKTATQLPSTTRLSQEL
jgi:hypothetical protein